MRSHGLNLCPAAIVAVFLMLAGICLVDQDKDEGFSFEVTLLGPGEFTSIQLDVPRDFFYEHGVELGDCMILDFPEKQLKGYFIRDHNGIATLDVYLNCYTDDQIVELGIYDYDIFSVIDYEYGSTVRITTTKEKADYYDRIPHYMAGYSDDRNDFESSVAYGNYREVTQGGFRDDRLYRSASPMQPNGTRNIYCDQYLRDVGAGHIFSISIDMEDVESYRYDGSYAFELYDQGKVIAKALSPSILCHHDEVLFVMDTMLDTEGSIGLSCSQGKDRTGLYCAMLEALAGASYQEIRDDYLLSMVYYYKIEPHSVEYDTVGSMVIDRIFYIFGNYDDFERTGNVDWSLMDIDGYDAEEMVTGYLLHIGMDQNRLDLLKASLRG